MKLLLVFLFSYSVFALDVPRLTGPVVDQASLISDSDELRIERFARSLYKDYQLQFQVLTIQSLEDETVETFSIKVVDEWKLGKADSDKGLLILLAKKERKIRVEVGQGLEGDIPDVVAKRGISLMAPYFKRGLFAEGFIQGFGFYASKLGVVKTSSAAQKYSPRQKHFSKQSKKRKTIEVITWIIFIIMILFRRRSGFIYLGGSGRTRGFGGGFGGSSGGGWSGGGGGFSGGGASGDF